VTTWEAEGPSPRGRGSPASCPCSGISCGAIPARAGEPQTHGIGRVAWGGHPRAGGGAAARVSRGVADEGPSPRGRGSHRLVGRAQPDRGAIPARAGEPQSADDPQRVRGGHPRAGGGATRVYGSGSWVAGPSPRGRGSQQHRLCVAKLRGAIPARAGEPQTAPLAYSRPRGHPRAGGGAAASLAGVCAAKGPSPRGRGSRTAPSCRPPLGGAIPARAGEPPAGLNRGSAPRGHPRAGGGAALPHVPTSFFGGPSPRGRGSL